MNETLLKELSQKEVSKAHQAILDKVVTCVRTSRSVMSKSYPEWNDMSKAYDSERLRDKQDLKNAATGNPEKTSVPLTYAQVNTFVAFMFMLFHQRQYFFEFEGQGKEDETIQAVSESIIQGDLQSNGFSLKLYQFLLDIGRFGIGVFKSSWEVEKQQFLSPEAKEAFKGIDDVTPELYEDHVTFEGSRITSISPYHFYPDTRLPLTRFQEGEFCASEEEFPLHKLQELEARGGVAGVEHITPFNDASRSNREGHSYFPSIKLDDADTQKSNVVITECQIKLIPDKFEMEDGSMLGNSSKPLTYLVWVANDNRVIRIEPLNYYHGHFTYDLSQFSPDMHKQLSKSLAGQITQLQEIIDWFFNSRVASVHRTLDNQLVVDPTVVEMNTVTNNSRVIKLKRGAPRVGIDRFIKSLPVQDVTANHMQDASQVGSIIQQVTGINDTAMGQFQTGRRSATEARGAISGSASRLNLYGKLIWESGLAPLGKKLLINSRQSLSQEGYESIVGTDPEKLEMFEEFKSNVFQLVRRSDFFVFDGTLPSEKQYAAQSLQELLSIVLSSPEAAAATGVQPAKLIEEIYTLRGIKNLSRFKDDGTAAQQQAMVQQILAQQQQAPQQQQQTQ
tara:strand:- start:29438 stop:31294 length:1857 start_codon:yes stop_codon:yes gene_type:complete